MKSWKRWGAALCAVTIWTAMGALPSAAAETSSSPSTSSQGETSQRVACSFRVVDTAGEPIVNMGLQFTPQFDAPKDFITFERRVIQTDVDGWMETRMVPGSYLVRLCDPRQDWALGDEAPQQLFQINVKPSEYGRQYTLMWRKTSPEQFLETVEDRVTFTFIDQDGLPANLLEVHMDYRTNKDRPDYGQTPGGYANRDGRYTCLRPQEKEVTLFLYDYTDEPIIKELTLPALSGSVQVTVPVEIFKKTNPAT